MVVVIIVATHDGVKVVKVVEVLPEAGPVQVGPGRGDVGVVGVGLGAAVRAAHGSPWVVSGRSKLHVTSIASTHRGELVSNCSIS